MGVGRWRQRAPLWAPLWALALALACAQHPAPNAAHNGRVCSTWGDSHFKTFDGDVFRFPGRCSYVFSAHCGAAHEDFSVQLRRGPGTAAATAAPGRVTLRLSGMAIELTKASVLVDGRPVQLPFGRAGVLVQRGRSFLKVAARLGLVFMWNQDDSLLLELDPKYANQTCGLCGDFNGVPGVHEFFSHGARLTPSEFGSLQKMDGPTERCEDADAGAPADCSTGASVCEGILSGEPFAGCNALVDAGSYVDACRRDLCRCQLADPARCLCDTLAEYSRQCAHAGGLPLDWRGPDLCPQTCPLDMQHHECGSPCADTCSNREHSQLCEDHCVSGCFCPEGTVLDDVGQTGCIPVSQCPCVYNGATYTPGAVYSTDCTNCTCSQGRWRCQELPCPGTCSVLGGAHFSTFDERPYTVHGDCSYVLAKPCEGGAFTVLAELRPCGRTDSETCLRSLTLSLAGGQTVIVVKASGEVFVNQIHTQLPVSAANVTLFRPSTFFVIAQTNLGLQVDVQLVPAMQVFVRLAPELRGLTCGLCGNFNQNQADDLRALSGVVEGTAAAFANTWKTQAACPNVRNTFEDPCSLSVEKEKYAQHWCSRLTDPQGPFAPCHAAVSPGTYFSNCLFDTCTCERSEECLCAALSSYVRACAARGVLLRGWRDGVCAKPTDTCPASMTYQYNISTCQPTCWARSNEDVTCSVSFVPVDGCACPHGTFLDDEGECVPATSCPCYYGDSTVPSGESLQEHGAVCTCTQGTLTCIGGQAPAPVCVPPMAYVDCRNATPGTAGAGCQKSCQTLDMDCYSPQCVPGCVCPDGLVADGEGGCVAVADCPCVHNEASYQAGQTVRVGCNTCTCKSRMWHCTDEPCLATCTVYGDGHYLTFDGQRYGFNGDCEYTLVQDDCGGNGSAQDTFHVVTENVPCGTTGTTCSKAIKIFLGSHELKLSDGQVKVTEKGAGQEAPFSVRREGLYLVVDTEAGLLLTWDRKTSLSLRLRPEFKGRVCGLCGNFDDNAANDFTTRSRSVVGDVLEFGNSWKFSPSCPDAPAPRDPCAANPSRKSWAQKQCSIVHGPVFAACHAHVEPAPYYEACVSDACACDSGGDCECFCTAVAAYARACRDAGACVAWRTPDVCPLFCDYYNPDGECEWHYQPCGAPCLRTCRNPSGRCPHDVRGLEGCYPRCPPEAPTFDEDQMRCVATCPPPPCQVQGKSYRPGAVVPANGTCLSCVCTESGVQCSYKAEACVCTYGGRRFRPGAVIYDTTDGTGGCLSARCGANGTIERTVHGCGSAGPSPAPHTAFSFSTPPTAISSTLQPGTHPGPATSQAPTGTPRRAPATAVGTSPGPMPPAASDSPGPGCGEECQWSPWLDVSRPGRGVDSGDYDTLDNLRAHGHRVCRAPRAVECRAEDAPGGLHRALGPRVECSPTTGLTCHNRDQVSGLCDNYQIKVLCCSPLPCPTARGRAQTTLPATHRTTDTGSSAPLVTTAGPSTASVTSKTRAPGTSTPALGTTTPAPGSSAPAPGTVTSAPGTSTPAPDTTTPAPGSSTPAPDTTTPAPGSSAPAPGTATPAPGTSTPAPGTSTPVPGSSVSAPGTVTSAPGTSTPAPGTAPTVKTTVSTPSPTPLSTASVTTPVPTTAPGPSGEPTAPEPSPACFRESCGWTDWMDGSYPEAGIDGGDFDTFQNLRSKGFKFCQRPSKVECRAEGFPDTPLAALGQDVVCSRALGLLCLNRRQLPPICYNYEVRVLCCQPVDVCRGGTATPTPPGATRPAPRTANTHTQASGGSGGPSTALRHSRASSGHVPPAHAVTPPGATACRPQCMWTKWFDSDFPSPGPHGGDTETYSNIVRSGERVCRQPEHVTRLECRAESHPEVSIARLGQVVRCDPGVGLVCRNRDQLGRFQMCFNYEVRVLCCEPREGCPSLGPVTVLSTHSVSAASPTGSTAHVATFSTTSAPETSTTPVPGTSVISGPVTFTTLVSTSETTPPTSGTTPHVATFRTTSAPETSATSVHKILSTSVTQTSTTPVPGTSVISAPVTFTTPVSASETTSPTSGTTFHVARFSTTSVPETNSTSVPGASTLSVPVTITTSNSASETTVPTPGATACRPQCTWTKWFDSDFPSPGPHGGDTETYSNIVRSGERVCRRPEHVARLECRAESHPEVSIARLGQVVRCDPGVGLVCRNRDQLGRFQMCFNYEVRVLCCEPREGCPSLGPVTVLSTHSVSAASPTGSTAHVATFSTTSAPETSTTPVPGTSAVSAPVTFTTPVSASETTSPTSGTTLHVATFSTTSVPETNSTSMPGASAVSAPKTITTSNSVSETTVITAGATACRPQCTWTKWFDSDFPSPGPHGGDTETYSNIVRSGERVCRRPEHVARLECRAESHPEVSIARLGQVVRCDPGVGLVCRNRDQLGRFQMCFNYEVRVLCCEPREGCHPSAPPNVTSSVVHPPTPEPTSVAPPGTLASWAPPFSPRLCFCSVADVLYPAGSIIYQQTDLAGHCYYALCSLDCHVLRRTDHTCPRGSPPPATATSPPGSSPSTPVHVTEWGCPNAVPPRTRGETWAMPNCSQATCQGNNVITLRPRPCPQAREPTCANGYPAVPVADQDGCCQHYQCQCVCSGWGDPHYITFDGTYYTFLDDCTYVLVRQIVPVYGHFRVLITNYDCDAPDGLSCPQSIIVEYLRDRVVLTRKRVRGVMTNEILFDGKRVSPGFRRGGVAVSQVGVKMYVTIPEIGVQVMFSGLIFSVEVPFSKFANNTEGQCGTCTNDQKDECRLPGGAVVSSCSAMSGHWKVTDPSQPSCDGPPPAPSTVGPKTSPAQCPPSPICLLILSAVFKQCHSVIPPQPYYQGCVFDQCHVTDPQVVCSGLELYAALCASHGACVDWRGWTNHTCPFTCPADKVYRPCGPSSPSYCYGRDSVSLAALQDAGPVSEGCFCPEGMTLFSTNVDICVPTGCHSCLGPRGEPVEPGHTVTVDCRECTCDGGTRTLRCRTQPCPPPPACPEPGRVPVPAAPQAGQCCPQYSCACNTSYCPAPADCPEGSRQLLAYEEGACCPSRKCSWTVCSVNGTVYQPGAVVSSSPCETCRCQAPSSPLSGPFVISCETQTCSTDCPVGFEYQALDGQCCGRCVQVACVTNGSDGSVHLFPPGESWSDPGSQCVTHECEKHQDGLVVVTMRKACPPLHCPKEQARLSEDGCCWLCPQPQPQAQNWSSCAVHHKRQVVQLGSCSSTEPVSLAYCQGSCGDSTSMFSLEAGAVRRRCRCCQELQTVPRTVTLRCADGARRAFSYRQAALCGCVGLRCDAAAGGPGRAQSQHAGRWSRGAPPPAA